MCCVGWFGEGDVYVVGCGCCVLECFCDYLEDFGEWCIYDCGDFLCGGEFCLYFFFCFDCSDDGSFFVYMFDYGDCVWIFGVGEVMLCYEWYSIGL